MAINLKKVTDGVGCIAKSTLDSSVKHSLFKDVSSANLAPLKKDTFVKTAADAVQSAKPKVSLARNPVWKSDIPYDNKNYYRTLGDAGFQDFLETGKIRPKQNTKQNYQTVYFEKGHVNQIYAMRKGGGNYIVETNSPKMICNSVEYPHLDSLDKLADSFRIWRRVGDLNGVPHYEVVFDSM